MSAICLHCVVTGKVQGVFFRREACEKGKSLQLTGWVKNRDDGDLELMICGDPQAVAEMETWLWEGPTAAKVKNVHTQAVSWQEYANFEVKY